MSEQLYKDAYQEIHTHFLAVQSLLEAELNNVLSGGQPLNVDGAIQRRRELTRIADQVIDLRERLFIEERKTQGQQGRSIPPGRP